jgi:hypothetical protein
MLIGAVSTNLPSLSEVGFDGATVSGIPAFSATLIFVGIVILIVGVSVYLKGK